VNQSLDSLRALTRQLAETFASDDGSLALARLQRVMLAASRVPAPARPDGGLRLGIWDPIATDDGALEFVRSEETQREWRYWADIDRIPRKTGRRVALVGESVARGYLFDPDVTLAKMMSASLGVEVLDLARTDLSAPQLPLVFDALPTLEPDAIVLFAGNNWNGIRFELEELELLARAIRQGGFAECRRTFLTLIRARARATLDAIAARLESTPLCVVVPEFNLRDWRSEPSALVPALADTVRWLDASEYRRVEEMIALDQGTSAESQQLAAEIALARGDLPQARRCFEAARDVACGLMIPHSPRCPAVVQEELRAAANRYGFLLVDLPRLFEPLPDRRVFLDYCHLTGEGLQRAASAIAETIAPLLEVSATPAIEPGARESARAHLMAAVHNAHYGQPPEIVEYHSSRALHLDPALRDVAGALIEIVCRSQEAWLSSSWPVLRAEPQIGRYFGSPEMLRAPRVADVVLADAVATAAKLNGRVDEILIEEAAPAPLDLLTPRYRATTFREAIGLGLGPAPAYIRATARVSRFFVVRPRPERLHARLTLRCDGVVSVDINGEAAGTLAGESRWKSFELPLVLARGRNVIELHWPAPRQNAPDLFEQAARRLERGLYPEVLVAFGELFEFRAG
jgi:hypothetical protein